MYIRTWLLYTKRRFFSSSPWVSWSNILARFKIEESTMKVYNFRVFLVQLVQAKLFLKMRLKAIKLLKIQIDIVCHDIQRSNNSCLFKCKKTLSLFQSHIHLYIATVLSTRFTVYFVYRKNSICLEEISFQLHIFHGFS